MVDGIFEKFDFIEKSILLILKKLDIVLIDFD